MFVARNSTSGCPLVRCAEGRLRIVQDRIFNDDGQAVELDATARSRSAPSSTCPK